MEGSMEGAEKRRARAAKTKKGVRAAQVRAAEEADRRKEVLKESLREKLELERRALQVVERLLDDNVTEDFLTDCARLITPANYRDAVEERFITKTCGYPVCSNKLTNVPTQQYKISTKTNKVYDISERKCFCSNFCYKASKYLEVQISKSPLWLRKEERPPEVKLLKKGDGYVGTSGLEVKLADRPVSKSDVENLIPECTGSHGVSGESECSDEEQGFVSSVVAREQQRRHVHWGDLPRQDGENQTHAAHTEVTGVRREREKSAVAVSDSPAPDENSPETSLDISQVGMSKKTAVGLRNLLKSHGKARADAPDVTLSLLEGLARTLMEWRTNETMRFLYGPDYTSHSEAELQSAEEEEEELDEDDLEDVEKVKSSGGGGGGGAAQARPSAAAPDYETLRTETKMLELRVLEFYRGVRVLPEEVQTEAAEEKTRTEERENVPPLPPVDSRAQRTIQRSIAVEKLSRSLRDVLGPLGVTRTEISDDFNGLVRTFRFTNVNIIHKPPEWTLIAVVLLSVLTEVSPSLRDSMTRTRSVEYISSLMKELRLEDGDLQSLVALFKPDGKAHAGRVTAP
ncbi:hypothetical protein AMELA_G00212930 [Ameiurus melas]|uniref:RNA polymerase II subunit B1 CTD phosphatase RPAP2 homolog n=1 Tax=Ameiurus melas TaxID=219545 RepID=A0A7J6A2B2_AMEME|nr:hypothetical protein AMELA_G00212930 [Ameiurus melas]